jgi:hypothetical protein
MNEHWVIYLTAWAAFLTVLVTILVGIMLLNVVHQYFQGTKLVTDTKAQLEELEQRFNLSKLRTPDEILADARRELDNSLQTLKANIETYRDSLSGQIQQLPTKDAILLHVKEQYRPPIEIERQICQKTLLAFRQIKSLTSEEWNAIRVTLTPDDKEACADAAKAAAGAKAL